jgi:hypothetical protein
VHVHSKQGGTASHNGPSLSKLLRTGFLITASNVLRLGGMMRMVRLFNKIRLMVYLPLTAYPAWEE